MAFPTSSSNHAQPVLGLKPNTSYTIAVSVTDQQGHVIDLESAFNVVTAPLPVDFPIVDVKTSIPELMEPGFILFDRFTRGRNADPELNLYSIIVDKNGDVVWYSEFGGQPMIQLDNGNLFYPSRDKLPSLNIDMADFGELDKLGNIVSLIDAVQLHHDLFPTTHGTFLGLVGGTREINNYPTSETDPNAPTQTATITFSPVIEIDSDGSIINRWDPVDILDQVRIGYGSLNQTPGGLDWGHANAVFHDERDDSIVISIRHQDAVVKFSRSTGELVWILGNHDNWSAEFLPYLLTPVGTPFEWQYHQHAPMITDSGTIMLFDNGNFRASPFDGKTPLSVLETYSRAVEYEINKETMEVRQVWEYGTSSSPRLHASFISDADSLPITRNTLIDFGGLRIIDGVSTSNLQLGAVVTRIVEVTHETPAQVVFDIMLYNPDGRIQTYRAEKIPSLYATDVVVTH